MPTPCPWSLTSELSDFCETDLCSWVVEPGNTWSNLGFILIGVWIWKRALRNDQHYLIVLGLVSILTGIGSAAYHSTGLVWAGKLDLAALYLGTGAMTALNFRRWLKWPSWAIIIVFFVISFALITAQFFGDISGRLLYVLGTPCCLIELRLFFRDRAHIKYRDYLIAWGIVGFAFGLWWLDLSRNWCQPENHLFSGHAAWHILTAVSFLFFYRFYSQFSLLRNSSNAFK